VSSVQVGLEGGVEEPHPARRGHDAVAIMKMTGNRRSLNVAKPEVVRSSFWLPFSIEGVSPISGRKKYVAHAQAKSSVPISANGNVYPPAFKKSQLLLLNIKSENEMNGRELFNVMRMFEA